MSEEKSLGCFQQGNEANQVRWKEKGVFRDLAKATKTKGI